MNSVLRKTISVFARTVLKTPVMGSRLRKRFVAGETISDALAKTKELNSRGYGAMLDYMSKEHDSDIGDIVETFNQNRLLLEMKTSDYDFEVALKFSSLGLLRSEEELFFCLDFLEEFEKLVKQGREKNVFIWIDAEELKYRQQIWDIFRKTRSKMDCFGNMGICLQAYARDSLEFLKSIIGSVFFPIRICKGAYAGKEDPQKIFTKITEVRENFTDLILFLFEQWWVQMATHDKKLLAEILKLGKDSRLFKKRVEFAFVLGKHDTSLARRLIAEGYRVLVYVPFGPKQNQVDYLVRRIEEDPKKIFMAF